LLASPRFALAALAGRDPSKRSVFLKMLRRALPVVVLAAASVLALPSPAHADEFCPTGYVCIWNGANYTGNTKGLLGAEYSGLWVGNNGSPWQFSLKNKFDNRAVLTAAYKGGPLSTCTNPGLNRPFPPAFRLIYVSLTGQRCSDFGM
jgi:Peptidase inhibitor family I36